LTKASDMIDAGLRGLHAVAGPTVTYTEAGGAGQSVSALELKRRSKGMGDYSVEVVIRLSTITIDEEAWRGAQITTSDGKVYRVVDRKLTPGSVTFVAERALRRS